MSNTTIEQALQIAAAHHQAGELEQAETLYRQVLAAQPKNPDALYLLGLIAQQVGQHRAAVDLISRAIVEKPTEAAFHAHLGEAYRFLGCFDQAVVSYERALTLRPEFAEVHNNLGSIFEQARRLDEAVACYERAVSIRQDYAQAHFNLAIVFKDQGRLNDALTEYKEVVRLQPEAPLRLSSLLFALHMNPEMPPQALFQEHRTWETQYGQSRQSFQEPHDNSPDPARRLKIGYVSSRLWNNPEGKFLLPILANHSHPFEVFCYSDSTTYDYLTERLRACADEWHDTADYSEEQLAELIRKDGIDILVDLAQHSAGNRLPVFARKPAPVQVTYLAYPGTSGMDAMDYRLTDPYLDPPGENDDYYSETSIRLPQTYWCYQAPEEAPTIPSLPAMAAIHITFGCLNNCSKVNERVLAVWTRPLRIVPDSRLLLFAHEGSHRDRLRRVFAQEGVDPERVNFVGHTPLSEYFQTHSRIDIALDTFPYAGGTTTCDALWMGVPVVSLVGQTAVGRGGLSILSNIGLPELVAKTEDEYVKIAVELANDLPRLAHLRETMRERMQASPLMDAPRFAKNIEDAYRTLWRKWCEEKTAGSVPSL